MQDTQPIDPQASKAEKYELVLQQAKALIADEIDMIANMANMTALLKDTFSWFWIGFYRVDTDSNQLILGPFQGPIACTRIRYGKGVCGEAWATGQTQVIDDVKAHPNHIACSALSQSEIVVPIKGATGDIVAVLDIDSDKLASFDVLDSQYLEKLANMLVQK